MKLFPRFAFTLVVMSLPFLPVVAAHAMQPSAPATPAVEAPQTAPGPGDFPKGAVGFAAALAGVLGVLVNVPALAGARTYLALGTTAVSVVGQALADPSPVPWYMKILHTLPALVGLGAAGWARSKAGTGK